MLQQFHEMPPIYGDIAIAAGELLAVVLASINSARRS
jgi:hypothetical protein